MADRTINGSVRLDGRVYTEGDEDALFDALPSSDASRLADAGVLVGDWGGSGAAAQEDDDAQSGPQLVDDEGEAEGDEDADGNQESDLPDDLPGVEAFSAAGITTLEQVEALEDYTSVKGIGPATAADLDHYFGDE